MLNFAKGHSEQANTNEVLPIVFRGAELMFNSADAETFYFRLQK